MHKLIGLIALVAVIASFIYLVSTGKLNTDSANSKVNNIPTLKDVLTQTNSPLTMSISTNGLNGFADPNPANDQNSLTANVLTRDIVSEDVIRKAYNNILNMVQVSTDSGTGQGIQTKSISQSDALTMLGINPSNSNIKIPSGGIKLVTDPTSGLTSIALTQETINRAKTDPQLLQAITQAQYRFVPYTGAGSS